MWAVLASEVAGRLRVKAYPHPIPLFASGYHVNSGLVFVAEYDWRAILRRQYDMW